MLINSSPRSRTEEIYVYKNNGNVDVVEAISIDNRKILDVGCGAGDNARLLLERIPNAYIEGVTFSSREAKYAEEWLKKCWLFDIEGNLPLELSSQVYDCIIFSHVLEHLRNPDLVLKKFSNLLSANGEIIIAVPNILSWRMRLQFLKGDFTYQQAGDLDETHLRFFTYDSADAYLLRLCPELRVCEKRVTGAVPLWVLRRYLLPKSLINNVDKLGCKLFPNLFGSQTLLKLVRK